jgi:hypothetical protein
MKKNKSYRQGIFNPLHKEKYKGTLPIVYRSSLELKTFRWFDNNPNVVSWGSESVVIPYRSPADGKLHRYFVDANITLVEGNVYHKYLIEIKPYAQVIPPKKSPRKKASTIIYESIMYDINQAKWAAAREWCKKHNYKFLIFTEKHITQ